MLKRYASLMGAAILMFGALYGCGDSPSSPETTGSAVTSSAKISASGESLKDGPGDGENPPAAPGLHKGLFKPKPYEKWLKQLDLTEAQAIAVRRCLERYRNCLSEAETAFNRSVREANTAYERAVREVKSAVEHGTLTPEQGRERIKSLGERLRAAHNRALETAKSNVANCERAFEHCIREHLTRQQIAKWERLSSVK
jgi:hypothetical protein